MTYKMDVSFEEVLNIYVKNHKVGDKQMLRSAYEYADSKCKGIQRGTGEAYICHCLRVARLIAEWGFESDIIAAAILHDVVEDCNTTLDEIAEMFGSQVATIVDAVTHLSDRDFADHTLTKEQTDLLSDAKLLSKMTAKALYVKIADRIDNLNTLSGVPEEKRIPKAEHTREIIIPMARRANAYHFVDILEELCFKTEHPQMYEQITREYQKLLAVNHNTCQESLDTLRHVFNPLVSNDDSEFGFFHRQVVSFQYSQRTYSSIYRQMCQEARNILEDWPKLLTKSNVPLYDLLLIVRPKHGQKESNLSPHDIFFGCFENSLAQRGFYLLDVSKTTYENAYFFLLADEMDNLYRLFVRTPLEQQRFLYGNIVDENHTFFIPDVNEIEPRETYNERIKVFARDGSAMMIDKGATVLDLAFYIDPKLGLHFDYAMVDESQIKLPMKTLLNDGDRITIVYSENVSPDLSWFLHAKTIRAKNHLVQYFSDLLKDSKYA